MTSCPLDQFRAAVLDDPDLQQELRRISNRPAFVASAIDRARERGLILDPAEVEAALDAAAHAWLMRWVHR